jgi:hypothetical protein
MSGLNSLMALRNDGITVRYFNFETNPDAEMSLLNPDGKNIGMGLDEPARPLAVSDFGLFRLKIPISIP